jgi:drug/metabolite transporter (DMT)-like permease
MTSLEDPLGTPDAAAVPATPAEARLSTAAFAPLDWGLFCAVGGIWGASFLFIAIGLDHFHPGLITLLRVGLGAAALLAVPAARRTSIARSDRGRLLAVSVIWVAVPFTLFPLAEEHINSAVAGLLNGATPLFAGLVGALFFGRRPRGPQFAGMLVGFGGVALVSLGTSVGGGSAVVGVLMVLAATACYGVATNLAVPLQQTYGSIVVMSRMLAIATVGTVPFGLWGLRTSEFDLGSAVAVAVLGVVGTGLAFALMGTLVGRVGAHRATFITYLVPVVSLFLGVAFRDDEVTALALVGVVLVIAGALLASRSEA